MKKRVVEEKKKLKSSKKHSSIVGNHPIFKGKYGSEENIFDGEYLKEEGY